MTQSQRQQHRAMRLARAIAVLAVLAGASAAAPAQSLGLGRLFTSPDERIGIEMRRAASLPTPVTPNAVPAANAAAAPAAPAAPIAPPEPVQLNGVVRRSSGKSTVWLNQVAHADGNAQLRPDQSVLLRLSSGRTLVLKPGQSFNPADGTVQEATGR
jgi:type II secretory pathway component PulM